jgi:hypothetical protein
MNAAADVLIACVGSPNVAGGYGVALADDVARRLQQRHREFKATADAARARARTAADAVFRSSYAEAVAEQRRAFLAEILAASDAGATQNEIADAIRAADPDDPPKMSRQRVSQLIAEAREELA